MKSIRSIASAGIAVAFLVFPSMVSAHAVVGPKQVNVGAFQSFSLGVPSEKEQSTIAVKLVLPEGLEFVTPNVKTGWKVETVKHDTHVVEISWTGGEVPAHMRDDFLFSAKAPGAETTLAWKVYQTYADGSVVSWEADPKAEQPKTADGKADYSKVGPYSETKVVNDLASTPVTPSTTTTANGWQTRTALSLSVVALVLALAALRPKKDAV